MSPAAPPGTADLALPSFPDGRRPRPESRGRRALLRAVGLAALAATAAYLGWRVTSTLPRGDLWLALPFLALEMQAALALGLFVFSVWDVDAAPAAASGAARAAGAGPRIAVLVPTYDEGLEVLLPTIAAAVALDPPHETWVLDDGRRPQVAEMAAALGARYLTRDDRSHAKAGNLNHALEVVDTDLVAVLDADHVPTPGFLTRLRGYFDDPAVAVVQTPQEFYNLDSFEHDPHDPRFHEEALFYRVIQPGKNRWGAAFWCGTNAMVRVSALRSVGGVATTSITEDIDTTLRLHRAGWRSVYHNEVLARGLAPANAGQFHAQRYRWGTGAMQVLRTNNPALGRGLRPAQRLAYLYTLLGWFDAWRTLGYALTPVAVLVSGRFPVAARPEVFFPAFAATLALQQAALRLLGRGRMRWALSSVFDMVRMPSNLAATLTLLQPRGHQFRVTPKGRTGDDRRRMPAPVVLWCLAAAMVGALGWFAAASAGWVRVDYVSRAGALAAAGWLVLNLALVGAAIRRIRDLRYGAERRRAVRFTVRLTGHVDGQPVEVSDLSIGGAQITSKGPLDAASPRDGEHHLDLDVEPSLRMRVRLRGRVAAGGGERWGLEFAPGQWPELARLTTVLFHRQVLDGASRSAAAAASPEAA